MTTEFFDAQGPLRLELRRRRRALGLTQGQLATHLGLGMRLTYHRIESGARVIDFASLQKIAAFYGCAIGEIVGDRSVAAAAENYARSHPLAAPDAPPGQSWAFTGHANILHADNRTRPKWWPEPINQIKRIT